MKTLRYFRAALIVVIASSFAISLLLILFAVPDAPILPPVEPDCRDYGVADPCQRAFRTVAMLSPDNGWAAGDRGLLAVRDGSGWRVIESLTDSTIRDLELLPSGEGWAVGDGGTILHFADHVWTAHPGPTAADLRDVDLRSPAEGWAVGENGIVLRWSGSVWITVPGPGDLDLDSVSAVSPFDVWAVGGNRIQHWDGSHWTSYPNPDPEIRFTEIEMLSADKGWAAGSSYKLLEWDGQAWRALGSQFKSNGAIYDIELLPNGLGWAVGDFGARLFWNGEIWQAGRIASGEPHWYGLAFASEREAWSVGDRGEIRSFEAADDFPDD